MKRVLVRVVLLALLASGAAGCRTDSGPPPPAPSRPANPEARPEAPTPTEADAAIVEALVAFAKSPDRTTWAKLPLRERVRLGLGSRLVKDAPAAELADPSAWTLDVKIFRAYVGPFSALELLARHEGALDLTVGIASPLRLRPGCAAPGRRVASPRERPAARVRQLPEVVHGRPVRDARRRDRGRYAGCVGAVTDGFSTPATTSPLTRHS